MPRKHEGLEFADNALFGVGIRGMRQECCLVKAG